MALSNKDLTLELRESAEAIRQNVIEFLTTEIGSSVFEMWFGDLNNILIDERRLIIQADSPFALNQISSIFSGVPSHLAHNCTLIADQPFIVDLIVDGMAVGHDPVHQWLARGLAIHPVIQMSCRRQQAM